MPRGVYPRKKRRRRWISTRSLKANIKAAYQDGRNSVASVAAAPIVRERHVTHGDFAKNARVSQHLKGILREAGYLELDPVHTEAIDQMCLKLSRIVSGKAKVREHWKDIGGYANLGEQICEE